MLSSYRFESGVFVGSMEGEGTHFCVIDNLLYKFPGLRSFASKE